MGTMRCRISYVLYLRLLAIVLTQQHPDFSRRPREQRPQTPLILTFFILILLTSFSLIARSTTAATDDTTTSPQIHMDSSSCFICGNDHTLDELKVTAEGFNCIFCYALHEGDALYTLEVVGCVHQCRWKEVVQLLTGCD